MTAQDTRQMETFQNDVAIKFHLYNSLFLSLPFLKIEKTGILLSLLLSQCEEGFANGKTAIQILDNFLDHHTEYPTEQERTDLLFRFIQYIERQIVLFDALEDAAYDKINDLKGTGTIKQLESVFENHSLDKNTTKASRRSWLCTEAAVTFSSIGHFELLKICQASPTPLLLLLLLCPLVACSGKLWVPPLPIFFFCELIPVQAERFCISPLITVSHHTKRLGTKILP